MEHQTPLIWEKALHLKEEFMTFHYPCNPQRLPCNYMVQSSQWNKHIDFLGKTYFNSSQWNKDIYFLVKTYFNTEIYLSNWTQVKVNQIALITESTKHSKR